MKTQLLILSSLLFILHHSLAQPDKQWMIWNTLGKQGLISAGNMNKYEVNLAGINKFNLDSVAVPNRLSAPQSRNDIFVIYKNGENFNTRYFNPASAGFFYSESDFNAHVDDHNFTMPANYEVAYFYLTNTYEGDDLPGGVKVNQNFTSTARTTYTLGTTVYGLLTANHDVVPDKDITLIINYDKLDSLTDDDSAINYLRFDSVQLRSNGTRYRADVLNLQPVFQTTTGLKPGLPTETYAGTGDTEVVTLNPEHDKHGYINFRLGTRAYTQYGPDEKGNPRYDAIFTIMHGTKMIGQLPETIRASHDPNVLRVDSICMNPDGAYTVYYHLEFENTGDVAANELRAEATFPTTFKLSCLEAFEWYAGGAACRGEVVINGRTVQFNFLDNNPIYECKDQFSNSCKGYVNFRVQSLGVDLINPANSLQLTNPTVYFDDHPFALDRFLDCLEYKGNEWVRTVSGYCSYCQSTICIPCILSAIAAVLLGIGLWFRFRRRTSQN